MKKITYKKETAETIIKFWCDTFPETKLHQAIDMFGEVCQQYRDCQRKDRLNVVANLFIYALNVMRCDFLTGSQALEVANSCATDLGIEKPAVRKKINWNMYRQRKEHANRR